ncbi:MAG: ABC transporter ATP-binding protein [bacterium]
MSQTIIEVNNLGKKYEIVHERGKYMALRDVLMNIIKSPLNFFKSKAKQVVGLEKKEDFWALKDVNFTVNKGEVIGIIGRNGAGKSTMLKILSQITPPTTGEIKVFGRVGSLLEVGTGFHPELTGRENIFLNGAILGMTKKEIVKKFDQIIEFAGISKFLDTPVKYYSSGMYVRLAFSVAAHMEPDILIVDEVLAVGDADFQKKCLGKMGEITKTEGRTILFVSHNMAAIQNLCKKTIWLENGQIKKIGETKDIINSYSSNKTDIPNITKKSLPLKVGDIVGKINFTEISITNGGGSEMIQSEDRLKITLKYNSDFKTEIPDIRVLISLICEDPQRNVLRFDSHVTTKTLGDGIKPSGRIVCETENTNLTEGKYIAEIMILPQRAKHSQLKLTKEFEIMTDLTKYDYNLKPDRDNSSYLIKYNFKGQAGN